MGVHLLLAIPSYGCDVTDPIFAFGRPANARFSLSLSILHTPTLTTHPLLPQDMFLPVCITSWCHVTL